MRTYKFRAKSKEKIKFLNLEVGSFVYGDLLHDENGLPMIRVHCEIQPDYMEPPEPTFYDIEVEPGSVGQCVGIKDKNDSEVYENDIYRRYNYFYQIVWDESIARFEGVCVSRKMDFEEGYEPVERKGSVSLYWAGDGISEIVGNSIDNPEIIQTEVQ